LSEILKTLTLAKIIRQLWYLIWGKLS